jgi:hypothetical protein
MAVSDKDRDHFRRIGELKEASHAEARAAHDARTLDERLRRSVAFYLEYRDQQRAPRDDDPSPFYVRARSLGLYRP